jgi:hypothetical protein
MQTNPTNVLLQASMTARWAGGIIAEGEGCHSPRTAFASLRKSSWCTCIISRLRDSEEMLAAQLLQSNPVSMDSIFQSMGFALLRNDSPARTS